MQNTVNGLDNQEVCFAAGLNQSVVSVFWQDTAAVALFAVILNLKKEK